MDIGALSILMNQSKLHQAASLSVMKIAMDTEKVTAAQVNEILKNCSPDPNLGNNIDITA